MKRMTMGILVVVLALAVGGCSAFEMNREDKQEVIRELTYRLEGTINRKVNEILSGSIDKVVAKVSEELALDETTTLKLEEALLEKGKDITAEVTSKVTDLIAKELEERIPEAPAGGKGGGLGGILAGLLTAGLQLASSVRKG